MDRITFTDIPQREFPEDVQQCGACLSLVLRGNAPSHANWHDWLDDQIQLVAEDIAATIAAGAKPMPRPRTAAERRWSMPRPGDADY